VEDRTRLTSSFPSPRSVILDPTVHNTEEFDCGNESLNKWLSESASHARSMGTANTYVFSRGGHVIAYYTLSAHRIQSVELPPSLVHGSPKAIPAYLIGKLAVTLSEQGKFIGQSILTDAFLRACRAAESGPGARLIAVDAIDDKAIAFYRREHFHSSPLHPQQMYIKMSTVRKIVTRG